MFCEHVLCQHAGGAISVADHSVIFLEGTTFRENRAISLFGEEKVQDSNCPIGYYYYYLWTFFHIKFVSIKYLLLFDVNQVS